MKIKTSLLILLSTVALMASSVASAAVINSGTISGDVIVTGDNDLEFVAYSGRDRKWLWNTNGPLKKLQSK